MTEVIAHEDLRDPSLVARWEALADADPAATLFHRPRYLAAWNEVFGTSLAVRVHEVVEGGRTVGIVPAATTLAGSPTGPIALRAFLGGDEVTDYLGPVSAPDDRRLVARAIAEDLAVDGTWHEFVMAGLATDSGWPAALAEAARDQGLTVIDEVADGVCPRVDLADGHEAHLERLPGRLRQELVRKSRKLVRDAGDIEVVEVVADEAHAGIDAFLAQASESLPEKASFFGRDDIVRWFHALTDEFAADRVLRIHRLDVGGIIGAMTVSLVHRGEWGLYNSSFDPALGALAPGFVLVGRLIEVAADEGLEVFDLLRGDEAYKYRFGAVDRTLARFSVLRGVA